tara:strand:- start:201 stop:671 length:471 start_codon:yes stop_codon:yes gene_type:complete
MSVVAGRSVGIIHELEQLPEEPLTHLNHLQILPAFLRPIPQFATWEAFNAWLEEQCRKRQRDNLRGESETIGERLQRDLAAMREAPQIDLFELVAEQDRTVVGGTMQDMDDDHLFRFNAVEDQVVTMNSPKDTMVLEAVDEGEAVWSIEETLALAP